MVSPSRRSKMRSMRACSGFDETDAQDVAVGLQLRNALELNVELAALRSGEILQFRDATLQRPESCGIGRPRFRMRYRLHLLARSGWPRTVPHTGLPTTTQTRH